VRVPPDFDDVPGSRRSTTTTATNSSTWMRRKPKKRKLKRKRKKTTIDVERDALKRKIAVAVLLLAIAVVTIMMLPTGSEQLLALARWAESAPELAWPLYFLVFVLAVVAMFPGWLFMVAGGYLFGAVTGGLLAFVANLLGSVAAFFLARTYARQWVKQKLDHNLRFRGFDNAVARNGVYAVMFARLALLPNNLINYACGVSAMGLRDFVIGTSIGCLPILAANVLIGASTKDLFTAIEEGGLEKPQLPFALFGAIIAVLILAVFLARRFGPRPADPKK
jgi:uncharacterized membrane protein YdjX (TVP38/TMEM64 family)